MDLKIESMRVTEEGTQIRGLIRIPIREDVPTLGNLNTLTEARREELRYNWIQDSKEANKNYATELCTYRRTHLGLAILKQEDIEE